MSDKRYFIQLTGFGDGHEVIAKTAGQARYQTFKAWKEAGYGRDWSFRDFITRGIETFHHHGALPPSDHKVQ